MDYKASCNKNPNKIINLNKALLNTEIKNDSRKKFIKVYNVSSNKNKS